LESCAFKRKRGTNMREALLEMSTIEDVYALPDGERAELIDGVLYMMSTPTRKHQRIIVETLYVFNKHIKEHGGNCEVDIAPFGVYLFDDDSTYLEPDIIVICDGGKLDNKGCHGAPDLVIEVSSPSTRSRDCLLKLRKYEAAGVREYWIIDQEREQIDVYRFEKERVDKYSFNDQIPTDILEGLSMDFPVMNIQ